MEQSLDARIVDDYLVKKPFIRITPDYYGDYLGTMAAGDFKPVPSDNISGKEMTQADFLREYYVSGHKINSPNYYPDVWKKDENGAWVSELVSRTAFPFQQIIATKQLIHLTGNPIKIEDSSVKLSKENKETLIFYRQGWKDKNMEVAFFNTVHSAKTTGDGAVCFYYSKNKVGWKSMSYLEGDTLFMHYDSITGEKMLFIRKYSLYDEKNRESSEVIEAWDKRYLYRFKKEKSGVKGIANKVMGAVGISGWTMLGEPEVHGFSTVPVCYHRDNDVCWSPSQSNIENYEVAVSQLCENNKAYAFPILFVKGGDLNFKGQVNGRPYAIVSSDMNADAKTINRAEASQAFELQLRILLQNVFMGSFAVLPPEVKSGDLPGVAVKLLYSPAVEKAMEDAKNWDGFIDDMMHLFKEGYGKETQKVSAFNNINVHGSIEPYVHQNIAEIMQNLFAGVTAGYLSKETASQVAPYAKNDEYERLLNQVREEMLGLIEEENVKKESANLPKPSESGDTNNGKTGGASSDASKKE